ncbi:hypothetical protein [Loigolactobacillus coryniformis]
MAMENPRTSGQQTKGGTNVSKHLTNKEQDDLAITHVISVDQRTGQVFYQ